MTLLSTSQAAKALDVCESTIRNLERRGKLQGLRDYQGRRRFNAGDIDRLKKERSELTHRNDD